MKSKNNNTHFKRAYTNKGVHINHLKMVDYGWVRKMGGGMKIKEEREGRERQESGGECRRERGE